MRPIASFTGFFYLSTDFKHSYPISCTIRETRYRFIHGRTPKLTLSEFLKDINGLPMTILFTPEDLLRYLYKETSPAMNAAIEAALDEDWTLREKLEVLKASAHNLEKIIESPRTEVIMNILQYARESATATA
jgi:hypothetical protein